LHPDSELFDSHTGAASTKETRHDFDKMCVGFDTYFEVEFVRNSGHWKRPKMSYLSSKRQEAL
jgi:hypothetical protein